jgi:hypothetical protein
LTRLADETAQAKEKEREKEKEALQLSKTKKDNLRSPTKPGGGKGKLNATAPSNRIVTEPHSLPPSPVPSSFPSPTPSHPTPHVDFPSNSLEKQVTLHSSFRAHCISLFAIFSAISKNENSDNVEKLEDISKKMVEEIWENSNDGKWKTPQVNTIKKE